MFRAFWTTLAAAAVLSSLSACAPLIGAGVAAGADAVAEDEGGNQF